MSTTSRDLFSVDFHELAPRGVDEVRAELGIPPKSDEVLDLGSPGPFDPGGISDRQTRRRPRRVGS